MRQLSQPELIILVNGLDAALKGFYIDKIYEERPDAFRLSLSRSGAKRDVRCVLPYALNETDYIEKTEEPTGFALAARKRIAGYQIDSVEQYHNDRIMLVRLHKGDLRCNVIMEMFGKGNLIITDGSMRILLAYRPHRFQDRSVTVGELYAPPKNAAGATTRAQAPEPPAFDTLQKALDKQYKEDSAVPVAKDKELEALRSSIGKQKSILGKIQKEIDDNKLVGDGIFKNMEAINAIIAAAKGNRHVRKEELERLSKGIKILNVNLKEKTITVEMP